MYPNMSVRTCTYIYQQLSAYINDYECMANGNAWKFKDMWIKNSSCQNFSMLNTTHPARPHGPMGWLQILDVSLHGSKQCLMAQFKWGFRPSNFISHKIFYIFMAILEFALHLWLQLIGCPPLPIGTRPARGSKMRKRTSSDSNNSGEVNGSANDGKDAGNILRLTVSSCKQGWLLPCHLSKSWWFEACIFVSIYMHSTNGKGNWSSTNGIWYFLAGMYIESY